MLRWVGHTDVAVLDGTVYGPSNTVYFVEVTFQADLFGLDTFSLLNRTMGDRMTLLMTRIPVWQSTLLLFSCECRGGRQVGE